MCCEKLTQWTVTKTLFRLKIARIWEHYKKKLEQWVAMGSKEVRFLQLGSSFSDVRPGSAGNLNTLNAFFH